MQFVPKLVVVCFIFPVECFPNHFFLLYIYWHSFKYSMAKPDNLARWELGWRSGESTRLPPMWPGFDSRTRRHMWVEFVVGSRPCSEGFSLGSPIFLPPQKPTLLNSNSTWNARTRLNEFLELFGASWVNKLHLHFFFTCNYD